jgi:hypothetical protein
MNESAVKQSFTITVAGFDGAEPQIYEFSTQEKADEFVEELRRKYGNQLPIKKDFKTAQQNLSQDGS